jgi:hypothetical protein
MLIPFILEHAQRALLYVFSSKQIIESSLTDVLDTKIKSFQLLGNSWMNWDDISIIILNLPFLALNNENSNWNLKGGKY